MDTQAPFVQENTLKKSFSVPSYVFILMIALVCVVWFIYIIPLNDLPPDIKNTTGVEKIGLAVMLSLLYVALSPFAGFPYHGDTLGMILSTFGVGVLCIIFFFLFLSSLDNAK